LLDHSLLSNTRYARVFHSRLWSNYNIFTYLLTEEQRERDVTKDVRYSSSTTRYETETTSIESLT